jgi:endonuclease G
MVDFTAVTKMLGGVWLRMIAVVAIATLASSCQVLQRLLANVDPNVDLPPCVDNYCNCGDFISQELAQLVLDSYAGDPYQLDGDGNGLACESLPAIAPALDPETYFSNNPHLLLGNPSHAAKVNADNYLIERDQYALAYSQRRGSLHWASWQVNRSWLGRTERQNDFRPDGGLPKGVYQVTPNDYTDSGYDRGHMVPSADRTRSRQDNSATFLMSNIFPQTEANNRGPWRELENYCRDLIYQQGKSLYIIGGTYGQRDTLAQGRVTIPSRLWKVIVIFEGEPPTADQVTADTETVAVDIPNSARVDEQWQTYLTAIDRIELATGYDLLSAVPLEVQTSIEARR